MKFEMMINVLFELLSKRSVSASYIAEKYGVSVRSVYRYAEALEAANVPIYTTRGKGGGFHLVDTYRLSSTFMTRDEFELVIDSLTAISGSVPDGKLLSAINKLKATVKPEYGGFDVKAGNLIIDAGPWGDTIGYKNKLQVIEKGIGENQKLSIRYHDRNGLVTERVIDPHIILFKQGLWYVYAFCNMRKDFRFFKTGRIESATLLNKKFVRQDLSKMDLPLDFWHNNLQACPVTLEIDAKVVSDVEEWLGIENVSRENGKIVANVSLPVDDGLVAKIIGFGSGLKVVQPKSLKDRVKAVAEEILKNYS